MTLKYFLAFVLTAAAVMVDQYLYREYTFGFFHFNDLVGQFNAWAVRLLITFTAFHMLEIWLLDKYKTTYYKPSVERKSAWRIFFIVTSSLSLALFCSYPYFVHDVINALFAYKWLLLLLLASVFVAQAVTTNTEGRGQLDDLWKLHWITWSQAYDSLIGVLVIIGAAAFFNFTGRLYTDVNIHEILWTIPNMMPSHAMASWLYEVEAATIYYGPRITIWLFLSLPAICVVGILNNIYYIWAHKSISTDARPEWIIRDIP